MLDRSLEKRKRRRKMGRGIAGAYRDKSV